MEVKLQAKNYEVTVTVGAEAADPEFEAKATATLNAVRYANLSSNLGRIQAAAALGELIGLVFRSGIAAADIDIHLQHK